MATGVLTDPFQSLRCQCTLLDGAPVQEWVTVQGKTNSWVCHNGWVMPAHMWHIMCLWLMLGGKIYSNRADQAEWDQILLMVNPESTKLQRRRAEKSCVDLVFTDLHKWCQADVDHRGTHQLNAWQKEILCWDQDLITCEAT